MSTQLATFALGGALAAKGDMAGLLELAEAFELTGDEPYMFGLLKRYANGWTEADEGTRAWLSALAEQRDMMGSAQASAWREATGEPVVAEIILLPLEERTMSGQAGRVPRVVAWPDEVVLEAYPNPSQGPVYLVYKAPKDGSRLTLNVFDAKGREVFRSAASSGAGIVELNTTGWSGGIYVAELGSQERQPVRVKLSIQR